jgi:hypothetical protein
MPRNDKSKTDRTDKIRKILAGLQKYFGNVNLTLLRASYTPAALQAFLQADVARPEDVVEAALAGLEAGDLEVLADGTSRQIEQALSQGVWRRHSSVVTSR